MMAELLRETGLCNGKGGSMHLCDRPGLPRRTPSWPATSPCRRRGARQQRAGPAGRRACFFGDGASCEGVFYETLNMAELWKLPLIFVCENNGVAISVPTASQATPDIADRARGFGSRADRRRQRCGWPSPPPAPRLARRAAGTALVHRVQDGPLGTPLGLHRHWLGPGRRPPPWGESVDPLQALPPKCLVAWGVAHRPRRPRRLSRLDMRAFARERQRPRGTGASFAGPETRSGTTSSRPSPVG